MNGGDRVHFEPGVFFSVCECPAYDFSVGRVDISDDQYLERKIGGIVLSADGPFFSNAGWLEIVESTADRIVGRFDFIAAKPDSLYNLAGPTFRVRGSFWVVRPP